MNKFIFILLSILLSGVITGIISGGISYLYTLKHADHPHQIIPTWMVMFVLSFIFAGTIAAFWSAFLLFYRKELKPSLLKMVLKTSAISLGITGLMALYFMFFM